jgi:DNA-directed RNA polymerase III subunit RPC2
MNKVDEEELIKPIKAVEEKWKLLPYFLRMRGLMRQHIDSFNHFIKTDIKQIVAAQSNFEVRSDSDPKFFVRYTDIYVGLYFTYSFNFSCANLTVKTLIN